MLCPAVLLASDCLLRLTQGTDPGLDWVVLGTNATASSPHKGLSGESVTVTADASGREVYLRQLPATAALPCPPGLAHSFHLHVFLSRF